jgi:hypothetical protein
MKAITNCYLSDIISRIINDTIDTHRESKKNFFYYEPLPGATDEEILEFIHSSPYFDERLKDFLLGNLAEKTVILSQAWEIEFIKKTQLWAESFEWLHGDDSCLSEAHLNSLKKNAASLTLPY